MRKNLRFRKADAVVILLCVMAAVAVLLLQCFAESGAIVVVKTPSNETRLSLETDGEYAFVGKDGYRLTVVIENGTVAVKDANCPDHVCVHTGTLSKEGACAVCVPAGITVTVEGANAPDAVVR